jgi:entericidin B
MARKILIALGIAAMTITTAACNTVKGVGEDIQSVGRAGEKAID